MPQKKWTAEVMRTSNALDIPQGLFSKSPREIAEGLKAASLASTRNTSNKFQSAMSMLNFFINRGGRRYSPATRARLEAAKSELRRVFGKPTEPVSARAKRKRPVS